MLPILESLTNGVFKGSRKTGYGRSPSVLVLLPTRELATQVLCEDPILKNFYQRESSTLCNLVFRLTLCFSTWKVAADFETYGGSLGLNSCCLYGGAPYQSQHMQLKRGVDIVVGTPGRVKVLCY